MASPIIVTTITGVSMIPNPVATSTSFQVIATVNQETIYPTIESLFEFPFDSASAGELIMGRLIW